MPRPRMAAMALLLWEGNPGRVPLDLSDVQADAAVELDALDREAAVLEQARQAGGADHVKDTDADEHAPPGGVQRLDARGHGGIARQHHALHAGALDGVDGQQRPAERLEVAARPRL